MACGLSQQELADFGIPIFEDRCQAQQADGRLCGDLVSLHEVIARKLKVLIAGPAKSGASTLFKQLAILFSDGFPETQRAMYRPAITTDIVMSLRGLINEAGPSASALHRESWDYMMKDIDKIDESNAHHFLQIWNDPAIQQAQVRLLLPSIEHFIRRIPDMARAANDFVPSIQDYLCMSYPTRGLVYERHFPLPGNVLCKAVYVGSSRGEAHYSYDAEVLFFVANLATCNNAKLLEEDLEFFERVCNARSTVTATICLLLNKQDLFEALLKRENHHPQELVNIHERYAERDYRAWNGTLLDAALFPRQLAPPIISLISMYLGRLLPIYYTTLTDSNQCKAILSKHLV